MAALPSFNSLNKALSLELARYKWIEKLQNRIALHTFGRGKAHIESRTGIGWTLCAWVERRHPADRLGRRASQHHFAA
jgi:hypothetical protein